MKVCSDILTNIDLYPFDFFDFFCSCSINFVEFTIANGRLTVWLVRVVVGGS